MPQPALRSCESCAGQTDANLHCARCHTIYCSRACQKAHWNSGGHKKACAGIARARRDTDLDVQSRALARVAHMSGGAPDDARCMVCLDEGEAAEPLVRGCACRGSSGWTHATCLVQSAAARAPPPGQPRLDGFAAWIFCSTCKQLFTGLVQLRLAIALWALHARALDMNQVRLVAVGLYAAALCDAGEHAEAVRLKRGILAVQTRVFGPEHPLNLNSACNLAGSLSRLGECAEAAVLLRTALAARTRTVGPDDEITLTTEVILVNTLHRQGKYAEAEAICRGTLEKQRRILGHDHRNTLASSGNLAALLSLQGRHAAAAVEIERDVLVRKTRLLGAEHKETLITAANLGVSLASCGQKAEGVQLLRDTLALSQRALGPNHWHTLRVLENLRALGFAAR